MKLLSSSGQSLLRWHGGDASSFGATPTKGAGRRLGDANSTNGTDAASACDGIGAEIFGDDSNLTCRCGSDVGATSRVANVALGMQDGIAGEMNPTDGGGIDVAIDCREGDSEVALGLKEGEPAFMETCGRYCDEDDVSNCQKICVGDVYFRGSPFFCMASIDGVECSSCHNSLSQWGGCPSGVNRIDFDCSNIGGRGYGNGHMCGQSGTITFEAETSSGHGYSGGSYSSGYSGSYSWGSNSSSSSSSDDSNAALFNLFFIPIAIFLRYQCIMSRRRESARRRRVERNPVPMLQRSIQLAQIRGGRNGNGEIDPVQLVIRSLLENAGVAVAKETIQDGHDDFEYLTAGKDDPVANELREAVKNGDWRSARDIFSQMDDNETRSHYVSIFGDEIEKGWPEERTETLASPFPILDEWLENEPDATCRILRAEVGVHWAWHARSSTLAFLVRERQWELCHARLEDAALEIEAAKALCPSDALIYTSAITIKMGLGERNSNIMTVEHCLDALNDVANDPFFSEAHERAQKYYCKKWHGSHQQMFAHAHRITSQLPDGHPLWVLIPMAHVERTMIETVPGYWERPGVVREIWESYLRAFPGEAAHTTQAMDPVSKSMELTNRNYFAFTLAATKQYGDARHQIRIIGRRPAKIWPWRSIDRYKQIIDALGFDVSPPNHSDITLTHAVATPIGEETGAIPIATTVEIV